jgi:phosphoenolpyruvate carboxykinase (ATP)
VPNVPADVLNPRTTWANPSEYDASALKLAKMFVDNFKTFEAEVDAAVRAAGPRT